MKSFLLNTYKIINFVIMVVTCLIVIGIYYYVTSGQCINNCSYELKQGLIDPIYSGGKWLVAVLGVLLIFPGHIFRKWLFYIAPPILILTWYLVQGISVYSGNLFNPTRAKMAENGMFVLAFVTTVFVLAQLYLDWKKRRK